jgi:hypothetical protein
METIDGCFDMVFNGIKSGFLSSYSATDRHDRLEQNGEFPPIRFSITRLAI